MPEYDVVLLPTFTQVEDWRKRHARADAAGLFAQTVTTWGAWISDLWELFGDGRAIVDSLQRQVVMQAAFDQADADADASAGADADSGEGSLTVSPGVVKLASRCVRDAAGVPAFEQAVDEACSSGRVPGLAPREVALLQGIGRYGELLRFASLVEVGQAAACLADRADEVFPRPLRVLYANGAEPDWRMRNFFDSCENVVLDVEVAAGAEGVGRMSEGVGLRFGFPAGRYAQPALVADFVREALAHPGADADGAPEPASAAVVVACKDPLSLYGVLEQELAREGVALSVQARLPFSSTDFGSCFLQLCQALGTTFSTDDLADAVLSPFSGFSVADARAIDKSLRADRIARRDDVLAALRAESDTFSQLEEVALDPDADILLGVFDQIAFSAPGRSDAWRAEQLTAVKALRACTSAARSVGADMGACARVLEDALVIVSCECLCDSAGASTSPDEGAARGESADVRPRVVVTTQDAAAQMGPSSCGTLVLCDLTSEDYPIADKDDAARTLFGKIGLQPTDTALARARRTFHALQHVPADELVCVRPLNDWNGVPTYPAAVLQELVDAYRADPTDESDLDEAFGLPPALLQGMRQRGEELLFANATGRDADSAQPSTCSADGQYLGDVAAIHLPKVALSRGGSDGRATVGFAPSPSQIEAYLDCPYKWFAQSRLRIEALDEGFGALERGSYAHAVLQEFYRRFKDMGFPKVNPDNIERARQLMRAVADELELAQHELQPGSCRYVAANQIEQRMLAMCKDQLVAYLDFESAFLPGFRPAYLEYAISAEDGVSYAGHPFVGTVDRVDVDDRGRAVIVDYKGSLNVSHAIAGKGPSDPGKVQARMYAQAVHRALGLDVVGALYVSYGKARGCAGAYDVLALDAAHLPNVNAKRSACAAETAPSALADGDFSQMTFADMLDQTEALVAQAIASMEQGNVRPVPSTPDSCTYCPCASCPERRA